MLLSIQKPPEGGVVTSIIIGSVTFGNVLGAGIGWWLTLILSPEDMQEWGWRIPFFIGGGLGVLGFIARGRIDESPVFSKMLESSRQVRVPVVEILKDYRQ